MQLTQSISARPPAQFAEVEQTVPLWVKEAARLPLAFAQVREDAALDQWVISQLPAKPEVLMVASGGCTAAALATMPHVSRIHSADPNPAQIAPSRLSLRWLAHSRPREW